MFKIFSNLIAKSQPEIKNCFSALEKISLEYSNSISFRTLIKPRLKLILNKSTGQVIQLMRQNKTKPSEFLYDQIANYSLDLVASGNYHVYRGVLSMVGEDLRSIYLHAINKLKESGDLTEDQVRISIENINNEIKCWG